MGVGTSENRALARRFVPPWNQFNWCFASLCAEILPGPAFGAAAAAAGGSGGAGTWMTLISVSLVPWSITVVGGGPPTTRLCVAPRQTRDGAQMAAQPLIAGGL